MEKWKKNYSLLAIDTDSIFNTFTISIDYFNSLSTIIDFNIIGKWVIILIQHPEKNFIYNYHDEIMEFKYGILFYDINENKFVRTPFIKIIQ